jgi:hypothetical protein
MSGKRKRKRNARSLPFEKPALAAISTIDEADTGSDAALREAVSLWYEQIRRRDNCVAARASGR